jgi:hypothetical protein
MHRLYRKMREGKSFAYCRMEAQCFVDCSVKVRAIGEVFGIKERFPGSYLVDDPLEFGECARILA